MDQLQMLVNDLCTALRDPAATEATVRPAAEAIIWFELNGQTMTQPELQAQWSILKRIIAGFKPKS